MWEVAPARLSDGSVTDVWRDGSEGIAWQVPLGDEPRRRRGRWRAFPYTAERAADAEAAFWGALCDEWERHDELGRSVVGFHFYMLQADVLPAEREAATEAAEGAGRAGYGEVRKRLIKTFDCAARGVSEAPAGGLAGAETIEARPAGA